MNENKIWLLMSAISFILLLALWIYVSYFLPVKEEFFGDKWVSEEIALFKMPLPWEIKTIQMTPVTIGIIFGILSLAFLMESLKPKLLGLPEFPKKILFIIVILLASLSFYEMAWSFSVLAGNLASLSVVQKVPDALINKTHSEKLNLVFYSKLTFGAFIASSYAAYSLSKTDKKF